MSGLRLMGCIMISILIPCYNRESLVGATIESALAQTRQDIEVIVVDNQSTDDSWNVIQLLAAKDSRIRIFQNETNVGPVRNWKRCLDEARGDYGKILWSDDLISPYFLEKTVPFLEKRPDIGFVYTDYRYFHQAVTDSVTGCEFGSSGIYPVSQYVETAFSGGLIPYSPANALFRLSDLRQSLMIDVPNKLGSDFAMHCIGNDLLIYLNITLKYAYFAIIAESLAFFRIHHGAISIESGEKKLTLHYNLAKAYFVETYRPDLIRRHNTQIWLSLIGVKEARLYKMHRVSDFYRTNTDTRLDYPFLIYRIIQKLIRYCCKKIQILNLSLFSNCKHLYLKIIK